MKIAGLQKLTALDYPGHLACNVFTVGCCFRCPYCHNSGIIAFDAPSNVTEDEVFAHLEKRKGILNGVCITGGEPLMQSDIEEFISKVRNMGYDVKLDTNGTSPQRLKALIEKNLVNYVAMDIKSAKNTYSLAAGTNADIDRVAQSAQIIMQSGVDYEFRTTVVREIHTQADFEQISRWIAGAKKYYLQKFVNSPGVMNKSLSACTDEEMNKFLSIVRQTVPSAEIR